MPSLLRRETGLARGCCLHGWLAGTERRLETDLRLGPRGQDSSSPADRRCWELETVTEAPEASRMRCPNDKKEGGTSTNASERGDNVYHPSERCMFFSERSFSSQYLLHLKLLSEAAGSHLLSSSPPPPPKRSGLSVRPTVGRSDGRSAWQDRISLSTRMRRPAGGVPFSFPASSPPILVSAAVAVAVACRVFILSRRRRRRRLLPSVRRTRHHQSRPPLLLLPPLFLFHRMDDDDGR